MRRQAGQFHCYILASCCELSCGGRAGSVFQLSRPGAYMKCGFSLQHKGWEYRYEP